MAKARKNRHYFCTLKRCRRVKVTNRHDYEADPPTYEEAMNLPMMPPSPPPPYDEVINPSAAPGFGPHPPFIPPFCHSGPYFFPRRPGSLFRVTMEILPEFVIYSLVVMNSLFDGPIFRNKTLVTSIVLPIVMVVVGSLYSHECPLMEKTSIFLFVIGVIGLFVVAFRYIWRIGRWALRRDKRLRLSAFDGVVCTLMIGLLGFYSYRMYNYDGPRFDPENGPYCDDRFYLFSYWIITFAHSVMAFVVSCLFLAIAAIAVLWGSENR